MAALRSIACGALTLLALGLSPAETWAWGGVRIGIGIPIGGPYYGYPYYPYYAPPVVVAPAPVQVVQPVYAAPPAVTAGAAPAAPAAAPAQTPAAAPAPVQLSPVPQPVAAPAATVSYSQRQGEVDRNLQLLADPNDRTRMDAAVQLGRLQATGAVDSLAALLASDRCVAVREAAARALGMIGSPKSLPDLQRATQADSDPSVRHTAQFAIDIIQSRQN